MRALLTVDREYWIGILKAILDLPAVAVVSHPSSHMHADLAAQDRERIEQRSQHMGPQGLAARQALLDAAMQEIEGPISLLPALGMLCGLTCLQTLLLPRSWLRSSRRSSMWM